MSAATISTGVSPASLVRLLARVQPSVPVPVVGGDSDDGNSGVGTPANAAAATH